MDRIKRFFRRVFQRRNYYTFDELIDLLKAITQMNIDLATFKNNEENLSKLIDKSIRSAIESGKTLGVKLKEDTEA